jgi:arylsulfatase A-like enzyme
MINLPWKLKILGIHLFCAFALNGEKVSPAKPNVLFIICDDLNDWILHPNDHPKVKTPNMDKLCKKGVSFTNAHVVTPVCGPSRKILMSGLYPHTFNSYQFKDWEKESVLQNCVPLSQHFCNNGYNSYGTGKLFHEGKAGDFWTDYGIGVDHGPWILDKRGKPEWVHPKLYGTWKDTIRYRDFSYGPLSDIPVWNHNNSPRNAGKDGWHYKNGKPFRYISQDDRDLMPDEHSAAYAVKILQQKHDKPFFLGVGFVRPHTPLFAPKKYFDLYPLESIALPPYLKDDLDDCADALKKRWLWSFEKFAKIKKGGAWKEWVQAYMACVTFVDDQLGAVLDALEQSPYAKNTIIVFTSDHGYHLGEKGAMQKWHLWEESTRVPFIVYQPKAKGNGTACDHPVTSVDLYPTLADLCSLPMDPNTGHSSLPLDGHSLRPFLQNPHTTEWSGPSVAFMALGKSSKDAKGWALEPHRSVRSKHFRYTLCQNGEEELYDHRTDPHEWTNLADHPEYRKDKAELKAAIIKITQKKLDTRKTEQL